MVFLSGAFLYCFSFARTSPLNLFDEGYAVYGAARILRGDVPYRDFFVVYPPGQFYLLAGIFKLFGSAILVERILDIFIRLSISAAVFLISARLTSVRFAVMPWMMTAAWLGAAGFYGYAVFPALLFSLVSIYCLLLYSSNHRASLVPIIGVHVGLATLFRVDVGMYTFLAQVPSIAILAFLRSRRVTRPSASPLTTSLKASASFLAGVLVPLLPMFAYVAAQASPRAVWSAVFIIPATRLAEVRGLPYPPLLPTVTNHDGVSYARAFSSYLQFPFLFYCPLLIYGMSALRMSASFFRRSPLSQNRGSSFYLGLPVSVLGLGLFVLAQSRADRIHLLPTLVISLIPLSLALFHTRKTAMGYAAKGIGWAVMVLLVVATVHDLYLRKEGFVTGAWSACLSRLERARCIPVQDDQTRAVEFVREHTRPDERIFVGNIRHDRVVVNDISFYFLADRHSATKYYDLIPGLATTAEIQHEIIQDLISHDVAQVVLSDQFENDIEPNQSGGSSGVTLLDDFIRFHYRPVERFGHYTILRRDVTMFAPPGLSGWLFAPRGMAVWSPRMSRSVHGGLNG